MMITTKCIVCGDGHVHVGLYIKKNTGAEVIFEDIDSYREFVNECQEHLSRIETKIPEVFYYGEPVEP